MQLLPPPVAAIAPDGRLQIAVVFAVEGLAKPAIVYISFAHVLKLARDQFQDNDIIEITDDRDIIRKNIFGVAEVHECGQDALAVSLRELPFGIGEHLQHRLEFGQPRRNEVGQRLALAYIVDYVANGIDNLALICAAHDIAGPFQRITKKAKITVAEFEG